MTSFQKIKSLAGWVARTSKVIPVLGVALVFLTLMLQSQPGVAQVDSGFDHATTSFPLSGLHEQVRCESCHIKGIFKTTPRDCSGCHVQGNQRGAKAKPVNHIQSNDRCEECHTVVAFSVARFNHSTVLPGSCSSCHDGRRASGMSPNHIPTNISCDQCHGTSAFKPVLSFDHSALGNVRNTCATCHDGIMAKGKPNNHVPRSQDALCATCHAASLIDYKSFAGAQMDHTGLTTGCADCHGPNVSAGTFAGITRIIAMPPTSPVGANSHIPSSTTCESCHAASMPLTLVPANAVAEVPGSGFGTNPPTGTQIHAGVTGGCSNCHETNFTWLGMAKYPISPATFIAKAQYRGFQVRPTAAGGQFAVADAAHPSTGECTDCHAGTTYFNGEVKPANHIPTLPNASCMACHTSSDYAALPTVTNTHKYAPSSTGNCLQCHGNAALNGGQPASYYAIPEINFSIKALPDNHVPFTAGQECQVCHTSIGVPVTDGATFANSKMVHAATNSSCETCHGNAVTGSTFAGVSKIVVLPATSPAGSNSHMPLGTVTDCAKCHALTSPATALPGVATTTTPGSTGFYPGGVTAKPSSAQVHAGITANNCNQCHADGMVWMSVTGPYPMTPGVLTAGVTAYKGFQTLPKAAGSATNINDALHPGASAGDCSACHTNTDAFTLTGLTPPTNHMPYAAAAACGACHKVADWATMPALTDIHANTATASKCADCHAKAVAGTFASSAAFVADGANHLPFSGDCAACHVGTGASIAALPVKNGAKFSGSGMAHAATTSSCETCHGATVTGTTFQGVTKIVVLPATSPAGVNSHIPTTAPCDQCHSTSSLATLVPGVATKTAPGTAFATPVPKTTQIHAGIGGNCVQCHDTNQIWMGMDKYPISPTTKGTVSSTKYTGFHNRPGSAGGAHTIADPNHPAGECADCHGSFDAWSGVDTPINHIPFAATAQCSACHTSSNFAVLPTVSNIHRNAQSTTGNCLQCHGSATINGGKPASYYAIASAGFTIKALPDSHVPYTTSQECMVCHANLSTPVSDGATFANSKMAHSATTASCATCHGSGVTGSTFAGVTRIVVLPPTSPMGSGSHIPTTAACDQCHKLTGVPALVPGVATLTAGSGATLFGTAAAVLPNTDMIHTGMSSGCMNCHEANYQWMGMSAYPVNTTAVNADPSFKYTGFQTRPTSAGGSNSVRDAAHANGTKASADCQTCHGEALGFQYFGVALPSNHIPYATSATCGSCHTGVDYSVQPTLTNIHRNAQSTTTNCLQCHGNATLNGGKPASYYAIPANNFSIKPLPDNHLPYTPGQECQVCHTSITTPVIDGATFANSKMVHTATNSACTVCHGSTVTGSTFAGVTSIVVLPATSPAGANSHMPLVGTNKACDTCHALSAPATAMAGVATSTAPGTTGFYPGSVTGRPSSGQVHAGISNNCNQCHADGMVWMSVTGPYPMTPSALTSGVTLYKGFQTLPKTAGSVTNINDAYHPAASAGDCSVCHTGTDAFALVAPPKHILYLSGTACTTCHTAADWATMPALTPIHANTVAGATCASCHAKAVAGTFASSAAFKADGDNHLPFSGDCAACHVASLNLSGKVGNGALFSGASMAHAATTSTCVTCHGSNVTGSTYQGVTSMVVLPPTSPMGASSHIPTTSACDVCHKLTGVPALVPGVATRAAGTGATLFGTAAPVLPSSAMIHSGMTGGCMSCHEANYTWMGMSAYPTSVVNTDQYRGFQTRPTPTGGGNSVLDGAHIGNAATGDCQTCHSEALGFVYFSAAAKPDNHIPYAAAAACSACHTGANYSVIPTVTNIHNNVQNKTGNCLQCHDNAARNGNQPASYYAIPTANFSIKPLPTNHVPYTTGQECQVCHTSITTPVTTGATFANSKMVHSATNSACDVCHGSTVTGSTFAGVTKIVVLPATSPAGASSHIPLGTVKTCDSCHALAAPTTAMPGVATSTTAGSTGFYPGSVTGKPTSTQIHAGITANNCNQCHADGMTWMSVTGPWPMTPSVLTAGVTAYKGFQTLPKTTGSATNINDAYHPAASAGDCSVCHTSTDSFAPVLPPTTPKPHMPYTTGVACAVCHTAADWATMPALTPIHANTSATCATCHAKAVAGTFLSSAAFMVDGTNHIAFNSGVDCAACHVGTGSSIAALPVVNGAKFSGSAIAHTAVTSVTCATCHGNNVTSTTFQGITKIVVMPQSTTPGTTAHIPSSAACDACHKNETPSGLHAGNAASTTVPGTEFGTVTVAGPDIHANTGVTTCNNCHNTGMVWVGVGKYNRTPTTIAGATSATQYRGFNSRPTTAGGSYAIADPAHATGSAATDDCSTCHSGTVYFSPMAAPSGHVAYTSGTACTVCHSKTAGDYSVAGLATASVTHPLLTAAGKGATCLVCHSAGGTKFAGCATQAACSSPPPVTYLPKTLLPTKAAQGKDHIPIGSAECGAPCHTYTTNLWSGIKGNMGGSGANATTSLNMHNLVYSTQKILCKTCHEGAAPSLATNWYNFTIAVGGAPNHHGRTSTTQDCAGSNCHKTNVFNTTLKGQANAALIRPVLRSAIIGSRPRLTPDGLAQVAGDAAGNAVFDHRGVLPGDCVSCHNGQMAKGLPAKHLVSKLSCDSCHRTTAWKPADFNHQGVPMGQCQVCHNGQNGPGKVGGHFVTSRSCDACHKVVGWLPVMYTHTSPQYVAQPDKTTCLSCHVTNGEIIPRQMRGGPRPRPQ